MELKKLVLNALLRFINVFVSLLPIQANRITFVSLKTKVLQDNLALIYEELERKDKYQLRIVSFQYDQKTLWNEFLYLFNCFKQIILINTSKIVVINDNNYVISHFKREGVQVVQVWHAAGAVKKFGNAIRREYLIQHYDYVIANSPFWVKPYSEAFNVQPDQVKVLGTPNLDHLFDAVYLHRTREEMLRKYPALVGKRVLLYAPTFRGNIFQGVRSIGFDGKALLDGLGDDFVLLTKFHPLLKEQQISSDERIIQVNQESIHDLFTVTDCLITDYSSIVFDFALLDKSIYLYVPDIAEYQKEIGFYVDYQKVLPGKMCLDMNMLQKTILENAMEDLSAFRETFFQYQDGKNTERVVHFVEEIANR